MSQKTLEITLEIEGQVEHTALWETALEMQ